MSTIVVAPRLVMACWLTLGCQSRRESPALSIDRAIAAATRALIAAQAPDGVWRSETYGVMKDGLALTPTVLGKAIVSAPAAAGSELCPPKRRYIDQLSGPVWPDGRRAGSAESVRSTRPRRRSSS